MAMNIVARRKMSLKGFAEGWDNCYLIVKAVNEERRMELGKLLREDASDEAVIPKMRDVLKDLVLEGVAITTDDDGTTREVAFGKEDVPAVVNALNLHWMQEAISVSTGTDRLKAMLI